MGYLEFNVRLADEERWHQVFAAGAQAAAEAFAARRDGPTALLACSGQSIVVIVASAANASIQATYYVEGKLVPRYSATLAIPGELLAKR